MTVDTMDRMPGTVEQESTSREVRFEPLGVQGRAKFLGLIQVKTPQGKPIASGSRVMVSLRELSFRELPEWNSKAEVQFTAKLSSTLDFRKHEYLEATRSSGVFFYVPRSQACLPIDSWVLFDGVVDRYLSLEVEITEVENARGKAADYGNLAAAAATAIGKIPVANVASGMLEAFSSLFAAIINANADDQVMKYATSFFCDGIGGAPRLVAGRYTVSKVAASGDPLKTAGDPFVTMVLDVLDLGPAAKPVREDHDLGACGLWLVDVTIPWSGTATCDPDTVEPHKNLPIEWEIQADPDFVDVELVFPTCPIFGPDHAPEKRKRVKLDADGKGRIVGKARKPASAPPGDYTEKYTVRARRRVGKVEVTDPQIIIKDP